MVARPGRLQSGFTAGEIDPLLWERTEIKYFSTGAALMENVRTIPQGGFTLRDGMRDIGAVNAAAARIFPFNASNGSSYDMVFSPASCQPWGATAALSAITVGVTSGMLATFTVAQQLDTMLLFHEDLRTQRIKLTDSGFAVDYAPFVEIPRYDYGGTYTNGVSAVWELEFVGLLDATLFTLTVSNQTTVTIDYETDMTIVASRVQAAILDLPNVSPGVTAVSSSGSSAGTRVKITFDGAGNEGDGWAVSGQILNKPDAAVLSRKITRGVAPGEPLISAERGYAHCGAFFGQRLLMGGFRSLPNAWMFSKAGDYYNYDRRFTEANGPALIPMDTPGGERIERIVANRNLLIFTSDAEYWLAERELSATSAPNHVQSSRHGSKPGVPIIENEGAAVFIHRNGSVLGEFRYTDVEGNFVATDISLLASHLMTSTVDQALRRTTVSTSGNLDVLVEADGSARMVTLLREQDVTAFSRFTTTGQLKAVAVNGRNEMSFLAQRAYGRRLERLEAGLLLDGAATVTLSPAGSTITGLSRFNGLEVWAIADGDVFGPFTVAGGQIVLPMPVSSCTVGLWSPPRVTTLPLPRTIGPNMVLKRRARIHSVQISVIDTTSVAVSVNGGPLRDIDLARYGAPADVPELDAPFTGSLKLRGLTGYADDPQVTISQVRPGRLTVRSIVLEAAL